MVILNEKGEELVVKKPSVKMADYGFCTLAVKFEVKDRLWKLRLYRNETMNDILLRILESSPISRLVKKRKKKRKRD